MKKINTNLLQVELPAQCYPQKTPRLPSLQNKHRRELPILLLLVLFPMVKMFSSTSEISSLRHPTSSHHSSSRSRHLSWLCSIKLLKLYCFNVLEQSVVKLHSSLTLIWKEGLMVNAWFCYFMNCDEDFFSFVIEKLKPNRRVLPGNRTPTSVTNEPLSQTRHSTNWGKSNKLFEIPSKEAIMPPII